MAVILAAGKGVRMNGNNDVGFSKAIEKVLGKPLVSFIIDALIEIGIKRIVVIKRVNDSQIENIAQYYRNEDLEFTFINDDICRGSLDSFYFAKNNAEIPFLLTDCDIICNKINFKNMIDSVPLQEHLNDAFGMVAVVDNPISISERMLLLTDDRAVAFNKSGATDAVCGGMIYIFYKNPFDFCKELINQQISSYATFFNKLVSRENIYAMHTIDMWDVDTTEDIKLTEKMLLEKCQ